MAAADGMKKRLATRSLRCTLLAVVLSTTASVLGQEQVFRIDPSQSSVDFALSATLHTVHGSFRIKSGELTIDPAAGKASGVIALDATSANTGNKSRDSKMHTEILESRKYPEIRFTVQSMKGDVPGDGDSQIQLTGVMSLHGGDHLMTITAPIHVANGHVTADIPFVVPYIQWGLKNPSTFLLKVSENVDIKVHTVGSLSPARK